MKTAILILVSCMVGVLAWPGMRKKEKGTTEDYIGPACTVGKLI
jgi:hypothetical protein